MYKEYLTFNVLGLFLAAFVCAAIALAALVIADVQPLLSPLCALVAFLAVIAFVLSVVTALLYIFAIVYIKLMGW